MKNAYKPGSIRYWQVKYERYIFITRRRSVALRSSIALENFLSRFNDRKTPDEISIMDVVDYKAARQNEGMAPKTIKLEIDAVRAFYTWLTDVQDVPTFNPAAKLKRRVPVAF